MCCSVLLLALAVPADAATGGAQPNTTDHAPGLSGGATVTAPAKMHATRARSAAEETAPAGNGARDAGPLDGGGAGPAGRARRGARGDRRGQRDRRPALRVGRRAPL